MFSSTISLLIFCLEDLCIFDSGVLKSPTKLCCCLYSSWSPPKISLYIWVFIFWLHICLQYLCLLDGFFSQVLWSVLLVSFYGFCFEVYSVWYKNCYSSFSSHPFAWNIFSNPSLSVCVGLFSWDGCLVGSICVGHVFLFI